MRGVRGAPRGVGVEDMQRRKRLDTSGLRRVDLLHRHGPLWPKTTKPQGATSGHVCPCFCVYASACMHFVKSARQRAPAGWGSFPW